MSRAEEDFAKKLEGAGHVLATDEHGGIDFSALEFEYCNGPMCVNCGECWCVWCEPEIEPCTGVASV